MSRAPVRDADVRRGFALLAALALLALAGALLAAASVASTSLARATRTARALARADAAPPRELARLLGAWGETERALPVNATLEVALPSLIDGDGVPLTGVSQLRRLGARRWALSVEMHVGDAAVPLARRRYTLLLERNGALAGEDEDADAPPPVPIAVWAIVTGP